MCGICGIVNKERGKPVEKDLLHRMCEVIQHRGPDDRGIFSRQQAGLGMQRLAIIDLLTGAQPIYNEDKSCVIVFNGEIYNHQQLGRELQAKGHRFKSQTDTEVIIHAYEEYGLDCAAKLNGMFAFAVWDEPKQRLLLVRDRIGIKPLYYSLQPDGIIFASEIKSILQNPGVSRQIDRKALDNFLTFEYIPSHRTIFTEIQKLPPAHYLVYEKGHSQIRSYWSFQYSASSDNREDLAEEMVALLQDAVKIRLMSDVPLGAFLSGGLDSSTIVALMCRASQSVKTFSIGFGDPTYNELPYARTIANHFNTEHYEEFITPDILSLTERLVRILDEPFGDFSVFPTFLVSQMARKHVTVVLSGDGGDELLAGYDTYVAARMAGTYNKLPRWLRKKMIEPAIRRLPPTDKKKGLINRSRRFVEGLMLPDHLQHVRWMIFLQQAEKDQLYSKAFRESIRNENPYDFIEEKFTRSTSRIPLDQQEFVDTHTYLVDDILVKVDRMSMANSLEARVPFLDHRFVEFAATIPAHLRLGKTSKYLLKYAFRDVLPASILNRGKEGFSTPIKHWMKSELRPLMQDMLSPSMIQKTGFFDYQTVEQLMTEHIEGIENHSHRLWALMIFQMWYREYVEQ
ncbi:asparagine synthase (glutamine-hydrolyzing) [candidate division KSB1 bacterium]|nr:asparagine synthase (glutamine-hydrolyzing) [candidate division KSB1 bacterium]